MLQVSEFPVKAEYLVISEMPDKLNYFEGQSRFSDQSSQQCKHRYATTSKQTKKNGFCFQKDEKKMESGFN